MPIEFSILKFAIIDLKFFSSFCLILLKNIFVFESSKVSPTFKFVIISLENKLLNKILKINKLNPK